MTFTRLKRKHETFASVCLFLRGEAFERYGPEIDSMYGRRAVTSEATAIWLKARTLAYSCISKPLVLARAGERKQSPSSVASSSRPESGLEASS